MKPSKIKLAKWAPKTVVGLIESYREELERDCENLIVKRDLEMWVRLASQPDMEKVWRDINFSDEGWLSPMFLFCNAIDDLLKQYDKYVNLNVNLTERQYKSNLQEISTLARILHKKGQECRK